MVGTDLGTIVAHLRLETQEFTSGLNQAQQQLQQTTRSFDGIIAAGDKIQKVGAGLTAAFTVPVAGFMKSAYEANNAFQQSMANVKSLVASSSNDIEGDMQKLTNVAKEYGATTQFSASQCADALGYMSLAGWNASQSASALGGVLDLAAASHMELADASDLVTDYLSAFSEGADQAGRMADVLAYAQGNANTTTEGLGAAFKNCAANANAFGLDIEQTTALISKLSDQGLKGSEAGTALTAMMRDITQKMKNGAIQIGQTSVKVQDANGNYRAMTDILADVEKATNGMGDAQKNAALMGTFTSDSLKALNILLNTGSGNIKDFENNLRNCDGAAADMAKTANDTLTGDLTTMKSAIEAAQIAVMEKLDPALRLIVQSVTKFISAFANLPQPIMIAIMAVAGFLAVLGPVMLVVGTTMKNIEKLVEVVHRLQAFRQAGGFIGFFQRTLTSLRAGLTSVVTVIRGSVIPALQSMWAFLIANPIVLVIAAIAALITVFTLLWNNCEGFRDFWKNLWNNMLSAVTKFSPALGQVLIGVKDVFSGVIGILRDLFGGIKDMLGDLFSGNFDKLGEDFLKMGENLSQHVGQIFSGLGNIINNALTAARDVAGRGVKMLFQPLIEWGNSINGRFGKAFMNLSNIVSTALATVIDIVKDTVNILGALFSGDFEGAFEGIKTYFENLGTHVLGLLSNVGKLALNVVLGLGSLILQGLGSAWNGVTAWAGGILSSIGQWLTNVGNTILNFILNLPNTILYGIGALAGIIVSGLVNIWNLITVELWNWGVQLAQKALEMGQTFVTSLINFIQTLPERLYNWLQVTYQRAVSWGQEMAISAYHAGQQFVTNAINFIQTLPSRLWSILVAAVNRVTNFANQLRQKGTQAANNFKNNIINGLRNLPSQMMNIGKNIVQGLWNGISGMGGWLKSQISGFASSIVNGFKSTFKIHSPSRVFRDEVGKWIPAGISVGIKDNTKDTLRTIANFSNQLIEMAKLDDLSKSLSINTGDVSTSNIVSTSSTEAAIRRLEQTIIKQNTKIDYNKLTECFVNGAANLDNTIVMDKEVVGKKVADPVRKTNDVVKKRMNRLEGILNG